MQTILLDTLVSEYIDSLHAAGYARNTARGLARTARTFLALTGNVQVRNITPRHVDAFFAARMAKGIAPVTLNMELVHLRGLFRFADTRRYMGTTPDPTKHRRRMRVQPKAHRRIPAHEFDRLLDACEHPRDRMVVALGCYLMLRQSEITLLRVGDVNLDTGEMTVHIIKTGKLDVMPVSAELDAELRRWLTWYTQRVGGLRSDFRLVPAKARPKFVSGNPPQWDALASELYPHKPLGHPESVVRRALVACGYDLTDEDGLTLRDGVHTLRRSAARAKFDELADSGYDGAGRVVQSLLHHSSFKQTEAYLGVELDTLRRDELIRGKRMYAIQRDNVTELRGVK